VAVNFPSLSSPFSNVCFMALKWSADAREALGRNWHPLTAASDTVRRGLSTTGITFRASRFSRERGSGERWTFSEKDGDHELLNAQLSKVYIA
jgi:hypothetical protein